MNLSIKKVAATAALALPIAMIAPTAHAAFITQWQYDIETGFDSFAEENNGGTGTGVVEENPNVDFGNRATRLSWGPSPVDQTGNDRSSVEVTGDVEGTDLFTNGPAVAGATFTHNNFVIPGSSIYLDSATILSQVTLTPIAPPGSSLTPPPDTFRIDFQETQNQSGTCPAGSATVCDDIFVLTNPEELSRTFTIDDVTYTASLSIFGLTGLDAATCERVGVAAGCVGFLTEEDLSNEVTTSFTITAQVPEPGTLSIMGLGLVGLALAGIRRNRRKG